MADRMEAEEASPGPADAAQRGLEAARRIAAELLDASRVAAQSLADEQKNRAARQVANIAEAVEQAARSLDRSDNSAAAGYTREVAEGIERLSRAIGERSWAEIGADIEDFARRQPAVFALGAVGLGFLAARFLAPPAARSEAGRPKEDGGDATATPAPIPWQTAGTAAAASGGNGSDQSRADLSGTAGLSGTKGPS